MFQRYTFEAAYGISGDPVNEVLYIADWSLGKLIKIQFPQLATSTLFIQSDTFPGNNKMRIVWLQCGLYSFSGESATPRRPIGVWFNSAANNGSIYWVEYYPSTLLYSPTPFNKTAVKVPFSNPRYGLGMLENIHI